jgi:hypothetical protein
VRSILRAILAIALLLGSGVADWAPASVLAHKACCCGIPPSAQDTCPCPKPEGNRAPSSTPCVKRTVSVAALAGQATQSKRRIEPRPEPAAWAEDALVLASVWTSTAMGGRDPDLGRHLARLNTFRI